MADPREFARVATDDPKLELIQDNAERSFHPLNSSPLAGARLVDVEIGSFVECYVNHGLNRVPNGWILVSPSGDTRVWTSLTPSPDPTRILILLSSAAVTCKILVF